MMQKLLLLLVAVMLTSCSDGKTSSTSKPDAGDDGTTDGSTKPEDETEDAGGEASQLVRAPGQLARPPSGKLPNELKPPR